MSEVFNPVKWGKKVYMWLSVGTAAIIWLVFFISLFFGRLSYGPVEATWFGEILKWIFMTVVIVGIVDGLAYSLVMIIGHRKAAGLDKKKDKE